MHWCSKVRKSPDAPPTSRQTLAALSTKECKNGTGTTQHAGARDSAIGSLSLLLGQLSDLKSGSFTALI